MSPNGGLAILHGNLAPEGAVIKIAGKKVLTFRGTARVFDTEEAAFDAVEHGRIKPGDVVVIRYEGPKGGPGMREMLGRDGCAAGRRARRNRGAAHRRPFLGRDARPDGRSRGAGSRGRRADRGVERRRHRRLRHSGAAAACRAERSGNFEAAGRTGRRRRRVFRPASWRNTRSWCRRRRSELSRTQVHGRREAAKTGERQS